jgi:hypothetical protein
MSVYIQDFKAPGAKYTVVHDDAPGGSHSGILTPTDLEFGKLMDGSPDYHMLVVGCPVCDATSYHPITGGAQPTSVQELAVRMIMRLGCPCGGMVPGRPALLALGHARTHVAALEGLGRWQVPSIVP